MSPKCRRECIGALAGLPSRWLASLMVGLNTKPVEEALMGGLRKVSALFLI